MYKNKSRMRMALICSALAIPFFVMSVVVDSSSAHAGVLHSISKGAKKGTKSVSSGASSAANSAKSTAETTGSAVSSAAKSAASSVADKTSAVATQTLHGADAEVEPTSHSVGTVLFDKTVAIGKQDNINGKAVSELTKGGSVIGYVTVEGGKITSEVTVNAGQISSTATEDGAKLIVNGTQIVGREVVVDGKVIGTEVIKSGEIVGHTAVAGTDYLVQQGELVLAKLTPSSCEALVTAVLSGEKVLSNVISVVPGIPGLPSMTAAFGQLSKDLGSAKKISVPGAMSNLVKGSPDMVGQMQRVAKVIGANRDKIKALFSPQNFCNSNPIGLDKALAAMKIGPVSVDKKASLFDRNFFINEAAAESGSHFYFETSMTAQAAAGLGATITLSTVTDFVGSSGSFVTYGIQDVTNVEAGVSVGMGFYPNVTLDSFLGTGWSVGGSGGEVAEISVDVSMNDNWNVEGASVAPGVGAGLLPVDVSVARTKSHVHSTSAAQGKQTGTMKGVDTLE
jgi:hypothetical protein